MAEASESGENAEANESAEPRDSRSLESRIDESDSQNDDSDAREEKSEYWGNLRLAYSKKTDKPKNEGKKDYSKSDSAGKSGRKRSINGAVAIIEYRDESTGRAYFLLEQKSLSYYEEFKSERGKLGPIGGAIDIVNGREEDSLEALMREIAEEIGDPRAKKILLQKLDKTRNMYSIISDDVHGEQALTYVYRITLTSPEEWAVVSRTYLTDTAGPARVLSLDELAAKKPNDFAFSFGNAMFDFLSANYGIPKPVSHSNSGSHMAALEPNVYKFDNGLTAKINANVPSTPVRYNSGYKMAA